MTRNFKKAILGTTLSLVILLAGFALGLLPLNLFFLKPTISDTLREHTGAELTIEGPIRLKLGWNPRLTAREIRIRFPAVTQHPSAYISEASIRGPMLSALRGEIDLSHVTIQGIVVNSGSEAIDAALPEKLDLDATAPLNKTLGIQLEGQKNGGSLSLSLTGASLNALLDESQEYPFEAELKSATSSVHFDGDFLPPWSEPGVAGKLTVDSSDLSGLLRQFGQEIPALARYQARPGYSLTGRPCC